MALMTELRKQMESKNEDELIELLGKPDEDLRFSRFFDLPSMPESRVLEAEYPGDAFVQAKLVRRAISQIVLGRIGPARFLDDRRIFSAIDRQRMLPRLRNLYAQMTEMNERVSKFAASSRGALSAKRILAFGLGGSAIGALLSREIIQNQGYHVPLDIHTSYPESFHGIDSETLVIICSFSGNTEETLYALDYAQQRTKKILILSRGGELGRLRNEYSFLEIPESDIQAPRESIGFWLSAFLFIVSWLGLAKKDDGAAFKFDISEVEEIKTHLHDIDRTCAFEVPFKDNPAKQYAARFLFGSRSGDTRSQADWQHPRMPVVFLDGADRSIGKRLASQFAECAEHPVTLVVFCEDAHNEIESVATLMLEEELNGGRKQWSYVFISSRPYESPDMSHEESRAAQRIEATLRKLFEEHNVGYLRIEAEGGTLLERKLTLLKLLDYTAVYASILRGTNPLPVVFMDMVKKETGKIVGAADRELLRLLAERGKFPVSQGDALSDETVRSRFPTLRHTILKRLIDEGYLIVDSGLLKLTDKGKELVG